MHDAVPASRVDSRVDSWARQAFRRTTCRPGVHRVGLALLEGGGRRLRFTASDRDEDGPVSWCDIDAYEDVPLNTAVRTGTAVMSAVDDLEPRYAAFAERQRDASDTAVLCLFELVTNALIHTDGGCVVAVSLDQGVLTVRVRDSGDGALSRDDAGDPLRVHGRGLRVVAAFASRWGSGSTPGGSTVWFELDLTP